MAATKKRILVHLLAPAFGLLALCGLLVPSGAGAASLVIWTDDGQQHMYDMVILQFVRLDDDRFQVFTTYSMEQYPLESIDRIEFTDYPTGVDDPEKMADIAKMIHLFQNYPNPFNPTTQIDFTIPATGRVQLRIYSVKGNLVRTLTDEYMDAGPQSVRWDGCDDSGKSVASGVYFYSLAAPGVKESRKMILLR